MRTRPKTADAIRVGRVKDAVEEEVGLPHHCGFSCGLELRCRDALGGKQAWELVVWQVEVEDRIRIQWSLINVGISVVQLIRAGKLVDVAIAGHRLRHQREHPHAVPSGRARGICCACQNRKGVGIWHRIHHILTIRRHGRSSRHLGEIEVNRLTNT